MGTTFEYSGSDETVPSLLEMFLHSNYRAERGEGCKTLILLFCQITQ